MKLYIFLVLILNTFISFAQFASKDIELDGKPTDVISSRDKDGNLFFLYQYNKSYEVVILDSTLKETKRLNIKKDQLDSRKNMLIGTIFNERGAVAYLMNPKTLDFFALQIDRNSGAMEFKSIGKIADNEHYLKGIEMDGKFYVIAIPKQKNQVVLYASEYGSPLTEQLFNVEYSAFYSKLAAKNEDLSQKSNNDIGIDYIRYDIDNSIKSAHSTKKFYCHNSKLYFIFDEPNASHIVVLDPVRTLCQYKKLNFTLDKELNTSPKQGNSFLYKGDFFRATYSHKQINLNIIYLDSVLLLKSYNFYPDKSIDIVNGVIVQNAADGQDRVVQKTSQFFNKINDGQLAIAVNSLDDGRYELQLGAYEEIQTYRNNGGNPGFWGTPGLSISIGFGYGFGFGMPYYDPFYSPGMGGQNVVTYINLCYFQSLLRQNDLEHVEGKVPVSAQKKIEDFMSKNFQSGTPEGMQLIPLTQGSILMGFYSKNSGKYKIQLYKRT